MAFPLAHGIKIRVDLIAVAEIVRNDSVHVGQTYGRVLLVDLFRSRALQESLDQREEGDTSIGYPADAPRIEATRRRNHFDIDTGLVMTHRLYREPGG